MKQYNKLTDETDLQTQRLREKRGGSPCPSRCFQCCRNTAAMPISEVEGHDLKEGLKKLPQEVKTHILKKATRSIRKLEQLGHSDEEMAIPMGLEPTDALRGKWEGECPMLVGGMCSVYDHRPLICRVWGYPIDNGNELACCHMTFIGQLRLFKPIDYAGYWRECQDLTKRLARSRKPLTATLLLTYPPKMIQTSPLRLRQSRLAFSHN